MFIHSFIHSSQEADVVTHSFILAGGLADTYVSFHLIYFIHSKGDRGQLIDSFIYSGGPADTYFSQFFQCSNYLGKDATRLFNSAGRLLLKMFLHSAFSWTICAHLKIQMSSMGPPWYPLLGRKRVQDFCRAPSPRPEF